MEGTRTCCRNERLRFIEEYRKTQETMSNLCRRFMISRKTGYQWVRRFARSGGWDGRAGRGGRRAWVICGKLALRILQLRERYPFEGPKKLVTRLHQMKRRPAPSTIGDFLRRQGLVAKRKRRRHLPPATQPFAQVVQPNDLWTVDRKGWFRTGDGHQCEPFTVMDSASRYLLYNRHLRPVAYRNARAIFESLFRLHGMPTAIRIDGGPPFAGVGPGALSRLAAWWIRLGIKLERIAPAHPEQNGRHERMHLTLKQQTCVPVAKTLAQQQRALDAFRIYYNTDRPHEALGQRTPASVYHRSPRPYPQVLEVLRYPGQCELRRVRSNGTIKWRGHGIYISQALTGQTLGLRRSADGGLQVRFATLTLGTIEQGRLRYQPRTRSVRARKKSCPARRTASAARLQTSDPSAAVQPAARAKPTAIFPPPSITGVRGRRKNCSKSANQPVTHLPV